MRLGWRSLTEAVVIETCTSALFYAVVCAGMRPKQVLSVALTDRHTSMDTHNAML